MKIVDNREPKKFMFASLPCGHIFEYENKMWMKIHEVHGDNAVTLENGFLGKFQADTMVNAVNAWLTVE